MNNYLKVVGELTPASNLTINGAIECIKYIRKSHFINIIECRVVANKHETIILDIEVERGQKVVNDIQYTERISIEFSINQERLPWVFALREDFPQVPHLNLMSFSTPKCLCLYEELFDEIILRWSAAAFIERIR